MSSAGSVQCEGGYHRAGEGLRKMLGQVDCQGRPGQRIMEGYLDKMLGQVDCQGRTAREFDPNGFMLV